MTTVSAIGALVALIVAIFLILKKVSPAYGMLVGALVGGLIGGADLSQTVSLMIGGAQGITTAVMRILAAGVLAGVLIESGAANSIAETITNKLGETRALLAMIGGGKAGNIISPNPNAIAAADTFHLPLTSVMMAGIIPALFGLILTYFLAKRLINKGSKVTDKEVIVLETQNLPSFLPALVAPLVAILLLALRPLFDIKVDPLIALPLGGLIGALCMGKLRNINSYAINGLSKMTPVAIMLLGTGALAGIIANSGLKEVLIQGLKHSGLPSYILAPISGALMSLATASTTAGTAVASNVFSSTLLELGISSLAGAAMIHAGATVFDHMPHGSFFHATGGSVNMDIKERLKLIPYESAVGLMMTIVSTLIFGVFKF